MYLLREVLEQAQKNGVATGHFNIADLVLLKAVFAAAQDLNVPVLVGASEQERKFRSPSDCGPCAEFAGAIRLPDLP